MGVCCVVGLQFFYVKDIWNFLLCAVTESRKKRTTDGKKNWTGGEKKKKQLIISGF